MSIKTFHAYQYLLLN